MVVEAVLWASSGMRQSCSSCLICCMPTTSSHPTRASLSTFTLSPAELADTSCSAAWKSACVSLSRSSHSACCAASRTTASRSAPLIPPHSAATAGTNSKLWAADCGAHSGESMWCSSDRRWAAVGRHASSVTSTAERTAAASLCTPAVEHSSTSSTRSVEAHSEASWSRRQDCRLCCHVSSSLVRGSSWSASSIHSTDGCLRRASSNDEASVDGDKATGRMCTRGRWKVEERRRTKAVLPVPGGETRRTECGAGNDTGQAGRTHVSCTRVRTRRNAGTVVYEVSWSAAATAAGVVERGADVAGLCVSVMAATWLASAGDEALAGCCDNAAARRINAGGGKWAGSTGTSRQQKADISGKVERTQTTNEPTGQQQAAAAPAPAPATAILTTLHLHSPPHRIASACSSSSYSPTQ